MAEQYPSPRAGQKVTGEFLASMLPLTVRKASDTSRATTTTLVIDPELQITVEANAVYLVEGVIYASNTSADSDINLDWTVPAGADGTWGGAGYQINTAGVEDANARFPAQDIATAKSFGTLTTKTDIVLNALLVVGSSSGTYGLEWAQNNATGTLTVYADSWLKLTRIA